MVVSGHYEILLFGSSFDYSRSMPPGVLQMMVKRQSSRVRATTNRWVRKYNSILAGGVEYKLYELPDRRRTRLNISREVGVRRYKLK